MICIFVLLIDTSILASVLAEFGQALYRTDRMKTSDGKVHAVEQAFTDGLGREVGLQKVENGYRLVIDSHGLGAADAARQASSIQQVVQRYAYKKSLGELLSRGYAVAEQETRADGSIRVVVRKWS